MDRVFIAASAGVAGDAEFNGGSRFVSRAAELQVSNADSAMVRWHIVLTGNVQGIGFRPFVHRLANTMGISGSVRNDGGRVVIEAQGLACDLQRFLHRLVDEAPAAAALSIVASTIQPTISNDNTFTIRGSDGVADALSLPPDYALCAMCLRDVFNPSDRRYRYAFTHCAECGPRYSVLHHAPYDRRHTAMAKFALCAKCNHEYRDTSDRRFHAELIACPECGPQLSWHDATGACVAVVDVIAHAVAQLKQGGVLAIKSTGGFHLVADVQHPAAVAKIRALKKRDAKPLAVLCLNVASARQWTHVADAAESILKSTARPIVLLPITEHADDVSAIAPQLNCWGIALPSTPLQYLLFHEWLGRPADTEWLEAANNILLVMTSANENGAPTLVDNDATLATFANHVDGFVLHDRDIVRRCDDSLVQINAGAMQMMRRARGFGTRLLVSLVREDRHIVALGALLKSSVCCIRDGEVALSPYIGDLDDSRSCDALQTLAEEWLLNAQARPSVVVCDRHPDFFSSALAAKLASEYNVPLLAVQHHHAHAASVMAEHNINKRVAAIVLDGFGLGDDGQSWGGELLLVTPQHAQRVGHFRALPMPGGDVAARQISRLGVAVLSLLDKKAQALQLRPDAAAILRMLDGDKFCLATTSAGRWFDAAASLLGFVGDVEYEAQAAQWLEALAEQTTMSHAVESIASITQDASGMWVLDPLPLFECLRADNVANSAARFHEQLISGLVEWVERSGIGKHSDTVVLSGGCFYNRLLLNGAMRQLSERGYRVLTNRMVSPGDEGLSLGQAWIALHSELNGSDISCV